MAAITRKRKPNLRSCMRRGAMTGKYIDAGRAVQKYERPWPSESISIEHAGRHEARHHPDDLGGDTLQTLADVADLEQLLADAHVGDQLGGRDVGKRGRRLQPRDD